MIGFQLINQASTEKTFDGSSISFDVEALQYDTLEAVATNFTDILKNTVYFCNTKEGWGPLSPKYSDLTICFINGGLFTLINLAMLVFGSQILYSLIKSPKDLKFRKNWVYYSRLILIVSQILIYLYLCWESLKGDELASWYFIQPLLQITAFIILFYLQIYEYSKSFVTNGFILFYWLMLILINSLRVLNLQLRSDFSEEYFIPSFFLFLLSIFSLLVNWLPEKPLVYQSLNNLKEENPYDYADFFSLITFSWMTPLMKKGYTNYLTEDDLPSLSNEFKSKYNSEVFEKHWNQIINKYNKPSLGWSLLYTFKWGLAAGGIFKLLQDILQFTQPLLLKYLIAYVNTYNSDKPEPLSKGFMIVLAMFSLSVIQTCFLHQYFWNLFNVGMNIKSSLVATLYKKSLKLSNEERGRRATGDIVNLMSVDTQRIQELTNMGTFIISGPFQIFLCLGLLYNLLGQSMWVGVFIMIICIPVNSLIMRVMKKLQKVQMKNKDERTRVISEILNNIKSLKLYRWEQPYKEKLNHVRNDKELKNLRKMSLVSAFANLQFTLAPFLVSCFTFAVYVFIAKKQLTAEVVFPALSLFNLLSFPLAVLPMAITSFVEAQVAIGRLTSFLTSEELQTDAIKFHNISELKEDQVTVKITKGTFLWQREPSYKVALANVNFQAKKAELTCIVGKVGSGKSALIQSILGDLMKIDGNIEIYGKHIAYVAQIPWIMNGTVKENILFGYRYDEAFYQKTIKACALISDFNILKDGDQTLVGEKGISLSGGQKARISLARAVYARADIYLLDDPLAAVDEHVGKHLIKHVLGPEGLLSTKTKILATNKISVLPIANDINLLIDGVIAEKGSFEKVTENPNSALSLLINEYGQSEAEKAAEEEQEEFIEETIETNDKIASEIIDSEESSDLGSTDGNSLRRASVSTLRTIRFSDDHDDGKNTQREAREQGKVKWSIYWDYFTACNMRYVILLACFIFVPQVLSVATNVWLKHWSEAVDNDPNPNSVFYLGVYSALGLASAGAVFIQAILLWQLCSIEGSKKLHNDMVNSVFRAPMSFFESTPIGRILNRFSNDIYKIDEILARTISQFLVNTVKVSLTFVVILYSTWQFVFIIIPVLIVYVYYQGYYMQTSRELRRLDSLTRSPIFAHFQETLGGSSTIRGFDQVARFEHINQSRVDNNMSAYFPSVNANRWLAVRLEFLGSIIILSASGLAILTLKSGHLSAGLVGLSVSYSLVVTQSLNWIVRMTVEVETNIVAVERVKEYSELKPEAAEIVEPRPSSDWPTQGEIVFNHYSTRYREDLDLVLKDINLTIKPKEKVGIVGRTGAGKSSLTLALYRIIEKVSGEISIDGIPIDSIGLIDLRHHLSIIPQDSQVFEGTIRENIDPTNKYTDEQIWEALELSHLKDHILLMSEDSTNKEKGNSGLDVELSEGGSNLSVGQRQLMCLTRALLIPSKILVLDEATAAVDVETDKILQETIRKEFKDRTILTIAHRLNTIMDSDKIIVLDKGSVKEFDSPENLLKNKDGIFYSLVNSHNNEDNHE